MPELPSDANADAAQRCADAADAAALDAFNRHVSTVNMSHPQLPGLWRRFAAVTRPRQGRCRAPLGLLSPPLCAVLTPCFRVLLPQ